MKYIITFGSGQLTKFSVYPNDVMLVIESDSMSSVRDIVFDYDGIGSKFCSSYVYDDYINEFIAYGMKEYTLEELEAKRL